jgi:hypothetical protein
MLLRLEALRHGSSEPAMPTIPTSLLDSVLGLLVKLMTLVVQYAKLRDEE